jgi:hypothetical protein
VLVPGEERPGVREVTAARDEEHTADVRQLREAQDQLSALRGQVQDLREQLEQAREQHRRDESALQGLEGERSKHQQLLVQFENVRRRAEEAERLCEERRAAGREVGELRDKIRALERAPAERPGELEEAHRHWERERGELQARSEREREADRAEIQRLGALIEEARSVADRAAEVRGAGLAAECGRLQEEVRNLRAELAARAAEAERLRKQTALLEAIGVERDRLRNEARTARAELEAQASELERLGRLVVELDSVRADRDRICKLSEQDTREREQLRSRLGERERSLAERSTELDEARRLWEMKRGEMQERWDRERRELLDEAERKLGEERNRSKSAARKWQDRLDDASQRFDRDREILRDEIEQLTRGLEAVRREREAALGQVKAMALEYHLPTTRPDRFEATPQGEESGLEADADRFIRVVERDDWQAGEGLPPRGEIDLPSPLEPIHEVAGRSFPVAAALLGALTVGAIGLLPYLLLPPTRATAFISMALTLLGLMIFASIEGRLRGGDPIRNAIQTAVIGGITIAAIILIGQRFL